MIAGAALLAAGSVSAQAVTFNRDVAPILFRHCAPCHHPGGAGPFSLLTFADAKRRARQIAKVTSNRYMPPWPPERGHGRFVGEDERRLSDGQIATLTAWQQAGAPEGDPAVLPPRPAFATGWQLGTPDLVLTSPEWCSGARFGFTTIAAADLIEEEQ